MERNPLTNIDFTQSSVDIACQFIQYVSVTPQDAGLLNDIKEALEVWGFQGHLVAWNDTKNLYLRWGNQEPHLCFAGHVDVVPPGPLGAWRFPPFDPCIHQGFLYGRGACDMKGAIGCFIKAFLDFIKCHPVIQGSCSILLTSDEEGCGHDGIQRMVPWLKEKGEKIDHILIGEPTGKEVGSVLQVGRRGSLTARLVSSGSQGHIAYPDLYVNALSPLIHCLEELQNTVWDHGTPDFEPSHLTVTGVSALPIAENVVPAEAEAFLGIRFNTLHTALDLEARIREICAKAAPRAQLQIRSRGKSFLTQDPYWIQLVRKTLEATTGHESTCTTRGGTTDGRFLIDMAPVVEVGLSEETMHQIDERVAVHEIDRLTTVYGALLKRYFLREGQGDL